ncbi:MAG: TIGR01244 family sulfur transferase [Pseudomonadota bacterium]
MKRFSNRHIFAAAFGLGLVAVLGLAAANYVKPLNPQRLSDALWVTEQITLKQVPVIARSSYATIIDLRPDGEVEGQPSSAAVKEVAEAVGLKFAYIPVPHGDIPNSAVDALNKAIADSPKPILMYCRSGRRAARTWGLVEASRRGGLDAAAILAAVKDSGQAADDLTGAINARIAKRAP